MDEKRSGFSLKASALSTFPLVDDHLVEPEVTRDEIIAGRRVVGLPNEEPEAVQMAELNAVVRAHVAPGYRVSADLLTRFAVDSDFGTDTCVRREGVDPATGSRYLEEIAFFVIAERDEQDVAEKAGVMLRRGVRRIFGIWAESRRICEWCAESGSWIALDAEFRIDDPCLVPPMPVKALFDPQLAENAMAEALAAKRIPALQIRLATARTLGRVEGRVSGRTESIFKVMEARGIDVSVKEREAILDRWGRMCEPCAEILATPLPIAVLLGGSAVDNAVIDGLAAKGNPVILGLEEAARAEGTMEGRAEGVAESILRVLEARGVSVSLAQRGKILCCFDLEQLDRWLRRATLATTADEVLVEPS